MKKYLKDFLSKIHVPVASINNALTTLNALLEQGYENEMSNILKDYVDESSDFISIINKWQLLIKKSNTNQYKGDLILICLLSRKLKQLYEKNKLSESLFYESLEDIKYKIKECEAVKGVIGVFCVHWYIGFFQLKIFKLGRLEYEISTANFNHIFVKENDLSISIHIPNTGEKLLPEEVDLSLEKAKDFFAPLFKNTRVLFKCNSWLLFEKNKEFLNENSNIVTFINRFTIVRTLYFDNYEELWRIFNCEVHDLHSLVVTNSLTKGYYEMVKNKEKTGMTLGYFYK